VALLVESATTLPTARCAWAALPAGVAHAPPQDPLYEDNSVETWGS